MLLSKVINSFGQSPVTKFNFDRLIELGRKVKVFAAKGPSYHYTYGLWRLRRRLSLGWVGTTTLDDETFLTCLDLERPGLSEVKHAVSQTNYQAAKVKLTSYFQTRTEPSFFFKSEDVAQNLALIERSQQETTVRAADQICQNIFHFRHTEPVRFATGIDWLYRPTGNIDWTWDLNRHAYFETLGRAYHYTGDERYAQKMRALWLDWLAHNPAQVNQPNWASAFEVAFRINTWIWAFYYLRASAAFDPEAGLAFLKGLSAHGRYLDANLELHVQNNHLLLEAKALAMLGLLFPEFKEAKNWRRRGLKVLYEQIRVQVCADGVHGERVTHYHRVIASELLELFVLLENNHLPIPPDIVEIFGRMVEFELWVTKPNGLIPLLSDSALEDTYLRFSTARGGPAFLRRFELKSVAPWPDEATIWLIGHRRAKLYLDSPATPISLDSRAFPEGGYFIMRQGQTAKSPYLVFDCGPFGYRPVSSHGHADALSFELYAHGQTLVVDPGLYSTHLGDDWRNFFRGSSAHNTVVVDQKDQSLLLDIWRVYRPAQATLRRWLSSEHFDFVDGEHNGYERLPEPITHRRQIFFAKPEYWVVLDTLTGQGEHCFDLYFHFLPGVITQLEPRVGAVRVGNEQGGLIVAPLAAGELRAEIIEGATGPIQGWVSLFSGEKQPAPTLRYRRKGGVPAQFCTVLYPFANQAPPVVTVLPLEVAVEGRRLVANELTGLRIETAGSVDYLVVDRGPVGMRKMFEGYETEAQLTFIRRKRWNGELVKVIIRGGQGLLFQGRSLNSLSDKDRN